MLANELAARKLLPALRRPRSMTDEIPAGKTMPISANAILEVRRENLETQAEFGRRFDRTRFAVIKWEYDGTMFKFESVRWNAWQAAVSSAIRQSTELGASNVQLDRMRKLQIFRKE